MDRAEAVLTFWFGTAPGADPEPGATQSFWFEASDATDRHIRDTFHSDWLAASEGRLSAWRDSPRGRLALVILLDQFSRNLCRGSGRAFAQDPAAQRFALEGLAMGVDHALAPLQRVFLYMPFMHAEDLRLQDRGIECFTALRDAMPEALLGTYATFLDYARRHRSVIERFGRFPHRNAELRRASTPEEASFLAEGGRF